MKKGKAVKRMVCAEKKRNVRPLDREAEQERLFDALTRFAEKVLFMANRVKLFAPETSLLDEFKTFILPNRPTKNAEIEKYVRVLQSVGNTILFQVDELKNRNSYEKRMRDGLGPRNICHEPRVSQHLARILEKTHGPHSIRILKVWEKTSRAGGKLPEHVSWNMAKKVFAKQSASYLSVETEVSEGKQAYGVIVNDECGVHSFVASLASGKISPGKLMKEIIGELGAFGEKEKLPNTVRKQIKQKKLKIQWRRWGLLKKSKNFKKN